MLGKLSNDFIWTRRGVSRWNALAEAHYVPGDEAMPGRCMFVQVFHCEDFSWYYSAAEAGVFSRCGSLHLAFGDLCLDQVANGDEANQPVSLHHGHVAELMYCHF
jgi:hypothetical protein